MSVFIQLSNLITEESQVVLYKALKKLDADEPIRVALAKDESAALEGRYQLVSEYILRFASVLRPDNLERQIPEKFRKHFETWLSDFRKLRSELSYRVMEEHKQIVKKALVLPYNGDLAIGLAWEALKNHTIERIRGIISQVRPIDHPENTETIAEKPIQATTEDNTLDDDLWQLVTILKGLDTDNLARISDLEITEAECRLEYIRSIVLDIRDRSRAYRVPALFIRKNDSSGHIRNLWILFTSDSRKKIMD